MPYSAKAIQSLRESGAISIEPYDKDAFKKASYTLHTGIELILAPGEWRTVTTEETVTLDESVCAMLFTRGSVAQMGIDALLTDCFIEPGFSGKLVLSMINHSKQTHTIPAGARMVKIVFFPNQEL